MQTVTFYNFMDVNTYEQIALSTDVVGDALKFVKENETVKSLLLQWQGILC